MEDHRMAILNKIDSYVESHHYYLIDGIRIFLGAFIFMKGYFFISDTSGLTAMLSNSPFEFWSVFLAHYVAMVHLFGGFLIMIGLITRVAILFQVPVLLGAIIFVNAPLGFFSAGSELGISIVVLSFLISFFFYGSGVLSMDYYMKKHKYA